MLNSHMWLVQPSDSTEHFYHVTKFCLDNAAPGASRITERKQNITYSDLQEACSF